MYYPAGPHDWLFLDIACGAGGVGLLLTLWALFWDRARGRDRCRKCWYDMSGTVLDSSKGSTCPECGAVAKNARAMRRTRRHWGSAVLGLALVIGGAATWAVPAFRSGRAWRLVPDACVFYLLPWADIVGPGYQGEVYHRTVKASISFGGSAPSPAICAMPAWKSRLVQRRSLAALERNLANPLGDTLFHFIADAKLDAARVRNVALRGMKSPSWPTRWAALRAANSTGAPDKELLNAALAITATRTQAGYPLLREQETLAEVATLLGRAGAADDRVVPALIDLLAVPESLKDWIVHPAVLRALASIGPAAAAALPLIEIPEGYEPWSGADPLAFYAAWMVEGKLGGRQEVLLYMTGRSEWLFRQFAIEELVTLEPTEPVKFALRGGLGDQMCWVRLEAADALLGRDLYRDEAITTLRTALQGDFDEVWNAAGIAARYGLLDELRVRERIESFRTDERVPAGNIDGLLRRLQHPDQ